jgi:ribosomal protein S18 acetylase RimI-like enzyme
MMDATDVTIRPAVAADMDTVGRLGALLVRQHFEFDALRFLPATEGTARGYGGFLKTQLAKSSVLVLVAERGGEVVGYTYAGMEDYDYMSLRGPAGALYDIVVDPSHRQHGIGRKLLEATLAGLSSRGAPRVVLSTAQQNTAAQRLFESAGFRRTMIEMTRELDSPA